jgi:hypothetical protein
MKFDVAGPFDLTRHGSKRLITDQSLKDLKSQIEDFREGLSEAVGCYVFALRAGKGYTPWYVGQACKASILKEAMNSSNREKYNKVASENKGTPTIFFIQMQTPGGKLRKRKKADGGLMALDFLERWLISVCITKNPDLVNNKETRFLRGIHVVGILNAKKGEAHAASQRLKKALW